MNQNQKSSNPFAASTNPFDASPQPQSQPSPQATNPPTASTTATTSTTTTTPSGNQGTSKQTSLEGAPINLKLIRSHSVKELVEIISQAGGKGQKNKIMVFDPSLADPFGFIVEPSLLKELGVESFYYLAPGALNTNAKHVLYFVRPEVKWMRIIAEHIKTMKTMPGEKKMFYVYFVPRRRLMCEKVLEEEGVWADVKIGEYHLDLIPVDNDLLSMELPHSFREFAIDGDRTSLFYVAKALIKLQFLFGIIPNIQGKGDQSQFVAELLFRMRREMASEEPLIVSEIDRLILIDRECDLVTPNVSQLTYEGMIDEVFGISNSSVDLPVEMVVDPKQQEGKPQPPPDKKIRTPLNSNDQIHADLRDLNFSVVGSKIQVKAQEIDQTYKERHKAKTVPEIRDFMKKLGPLQQQHQFLRIHTNIADKILSMSRDTAFRMKLEAEQNMLAGLDAEHTLEYIEECMNRQEPVVKVLRLLCLYSLTNNGIKEKTFNYIRREILQTYGYGYLFTLEKLTKLGMFKTNTTRGNPWEFLCANMNLIIEDINEHNPDDIAYVYSGFAPISCRLIEIALRQSIPFAQTLDTRVIKNNATLEPSILAGWNAMDNEILDKVSGGPAFHATQVLPQGLTTEDKTSRVTLVFFVGGCTFTEISACRFLNKRNPNERIMIATTKLINGNTLIESLFERFGEDEEFPLGSQAGSTQ